MLEIIGGLNMLFAINQEATRSVHGGDKTIHGDLYMVVINLTLGIAYC